MHHGGYPHGRDLLLSVQRRQRRTQAGPDFGQVVGPNTVRIVAFPGIAAGGDGLEVLADDRRLNAGGA